MAAACGTDKKPGQRRRNSLEFLPPFMSELRVVLLGNNWSERSLVGNTILDENVFSTEREAGNCVKVRGKLKKEVVLINTPNLLHPNTSAMEMTTHVKECASLSDPGPHVFLLVLDSEDFTEEHKLKLCRVLELLGDQSFDHCLILIRGENYRSQTPLKDMIKKCRYRYLKLDNLESEELFTRLVQTAKSLDQDVGLSIKPSLNLVLCGSRGAGKTSAAEAILGRTLSSASRSSECVKYQGEVCGRWVSLVELPALYGKPLEEVMEESLRCISLCEPEGVHAFVLVTPVGPLTDEDKGELEIIQNTFSSQVSAFTMILFTVESDPTDPAVDTFLVENTDIHELCQSCGGRYFVLNINDQQQVSEMLDAVEKIRTKGSSCFTKDLFTEVQVNRLVQQEDTNTKLKAELEDVKQRIQMGDDVENQSREPLRMVLIGKTGCGRSSTANSILGKKQFKSTIFPKPNKTSEKATGEINGRPVTLVRAPSLFNNPISNSDLRRELYKCISMLAPGPHVFLLVMQIGNFTPEEKDSVELIKKYFGKSAEDFTIIIFTRGDELKNQVFESCIKDCDSFIKTLINDCGGRYQVFNNKDTDCTQVCELITKIECMVNENGGCYFKMCDNTEEVIQLILKEKEEETKSKEESLRRKHVEELNTVSRKITELKGENERERHLREKEQKEKERCINKEHEERKRREEDEKKWKKQEENLRQDCRKKVEASERRAHSEREQREAAEKKLDLCRKEIKRNQEAWDKEKKDMWEQRHQDLKQNLEEEKTSSRKAREEFYRRRKTWMASCLILALLLLLSLFYIFQGSAWRDVGEQQKDTCDL